MEFINSNKHVSLLKNSQKTARVKVGNIEVARQPRKLVPIMGQKENCSLPLEPNSGEKAGRLCIL
jgi:hypothetical protein